MLSEHKPYWVTDLADTAIGKVPRVGSLLEAADRLGTLKVRLDIGRNSYSVPAGLYALGQPDEKAHVLVTANYKLTFDTLRQALPGVNCWLLVLNTKGVNVWCAAGKGTFGTEELLYRLKFTRLDQVVSHRALILPQLGAPGISAHEVAKQTGFKVIYGPVRATDVKAFLASGLKATKEMRRVRFDFVDRAAVTPIELVHTFRPQGLILATLFVLNLLGRQPQLWSAAFTNTMLNFLPFLGAFTIGCVLVPLLLPWIPFRSFVLKGLSTGLIWAAYVVMNLPLFGMAPSPVTAVALMLLLPAISAFLALNFTGSTTYTSFSGVKKEVRLGLKPILFSGALGIILMLVGKAIQVMT